MSTPPGDRARDKASWELPHWREMIELGTQDVYDVKFYPFKEPTDDPVFAAVGKKDLIVCRPTHAKEGRVQIIQSWTAEGDNAENCSIAWAQREDGCPLLCVGGAKGIITVVNAITGELHQALQGHGGSIFDLKVPRSNAHLLASCSEDTTIRLWSLRKAHQELPCVAIFAGEGHLDRVLSIDFHESGHYILSAGEDHVINMWAVPKLPDESTESEKPQQVHYPHFSTSEVHSNSVDCVQFYNDLVLSRGHEEGCIVLWQITRFTSSIGDISDLPAPTTYNQNARTRSAFFQAPEDDKTAPRLYKRLLQFAIPNCDQWFMRFSMYNPYATSRHPVLAMCNSVSKVFFWDLSRLIEYQEFIKSPETVPKPSWLSMKTQSKKSRRSDGHRLLSQTPVDESVASSSVCSFSTETLATAIDIEANRSLWGEKYAMGDPWKSLKAHKVENIQRVTSVGRAVAWSDDGSFCVVAGSSGIISVLERWTKNTSIIKTEK
ncbi:hypothetical protein V495_07807 [Pseudogymnoascus sp. VKM F-4514 (FW-929)]|nr:hypothetical protein V495_07807 [Pseudogymnoascus sp. VKM F-4514 (FW-929)]KFY57500.1 hypothetical protein V497_05504 [Pseudogymnoascus sp. VKM F-4516 (FW-969)]